MAAGDGAPPGGSSPAIPNQPYLSFAVAVLALHQRLDYPTLNPPRSQCSCGLLAGECPIRGLADRLNLPP